MMTDVEFDHSDGSAPTLAGPRAVPASQHGRLILTTADPEASPNRESLIEAMARVDFLGERLDGRANTPRLPSVPFGFARHA